MDMPVNSAADQMDRPEDLVERFHGILVESIRSKMPAYLRDTFTVAEIYQSLVPYRSRRDRLGLAMTGDYEDTLLRLLAGQGEFLTLASEPVRRRIRKELESSNPNTGIYREFAAAEVHLNQSRLAAEADVSNAARAKKKEGSTEAVPAIEPGGPKRKKASPSESPKGESADPGVVSACPECGGALPVRDSLKFCPRCGTNILEMPCAGCGEILDREWRFCVACGVPTQS